MTEPPGSPTPDLPPPQPWLGAGHVQPPAAGDRQGYGQGGYTQGGYGQGGYGQLRLPQYGPAPLSSGPGLSRPVAVEAVPGTPFGVAIVDIAPTTSGPAIASLVAGIGSILVALVVVCFGLAGAQGGWGPIVAGAFAILAGASGVGAVVAGWWGKRQVRRSAGSVTGRGAAVAGLVCGAAGLLLAAGSFLLAVLLTVSSPIAG